MRKLQSQGVHHITIVGANRQTSIDFWEGVLGMPFVFEQPNLDNEAESHLYFDPGDGRLITIFTNEERRPDSTRTSTDPGAVHHLAFALSQATFQQAVERLDERGIEHSGVKDRGFMDSIYFEDPLGLLIELASYRFEPPNGYTHAEVLAEAHRIRIERGDYNIATVHLADAIETLVSRRAEWVQRTHERPQHRTQRRPRIPQLGFGVFQIDPDETAAAVSAALEVGYRHIDTARDVRQREGRRRGRPRVGARPRRRVRHEQAQQRLHRPDDARRAFDRTLSELGFDYVDLFLIHWPLPTRYDGDFVSTWRTLEEF